MLRTHRIPSTSGMSKTPACAARALRRDELDRAQRAGGEKLPRRRAVRDLDALADAGEDDRVLADDVAAAQRRETDRARPCARRSRRGAHRRRSSAKARPMPAAAASPRRSAVPDGASTLCL